MNQAEPSRLAEQTPVQRRAIIRRAARLFSRHPLTALISGVAGVAAIWIVLAIAISVFVAILADAGDAAGCISLVLPVLIAGVVYFFHTCRVRRAVERGLRYMSCPRCRYSLRELPFNTGSATCPECGMVCDKHALGIDTREINAAARADRVGAPRALWTLFITQGLPMAEGLTISQRSGLLRAAGVARVRSAVLDIALLTGAVLAGAFVTYAVAWLGYAVLPVSVKLSVLDSPQVAMTLLSVAGAIVALPLVERWQLRRFLSRHPRMTICVKCRLSLTGREILDDCVVCPGCLYISSLYELGLSRDEQAGPGST